MSPRLSDFPVPVSRAAGLSPWRVPLPNGIVLVGKEVRRTPAVTILLSIRAGSICDPDDSPGAMHLLGRMLDRGTASHSGSAIAEALEDRGASLSVVTTRHLVTLTCTCLVEDVAPILALLAEMIVSPVFPDAELAVQKGEVVTQLRQDEDNPAVRAVESLMAVLYGADHPYGRPAKGTIASVEATTRASLSALHAGRFAPGLTSLVIVGDLNERAAVDAAAAAFGAWDAALPPAVALAGVDAAPVRRRLVIPMMNKAQVDVAYGYLTLARGDADYYAFWLLNVALGQYAMGGRLGENIRERQGMAYYASSYFDASVLPGPLTVRAGVSAANVERTIQSIDEELRLVRRDGLTAQEFQEARQYMIGSMPRSLETGGGIAAFLQNVEFFDLGLDYDVRLPDLLAQVTPEAVHALADRFLDPERAAIVIAGPFEGA